MKLFVLQKDDTYWNKDHEVWSPLLKDASVYTEKEQKITRVLLADYWVELPKDIIEVVLPLGASPPISAETKAKISAARKEYWKQKACNQKF